MNENPRSSPGTAPRVAGHAPRRPIAAAGHIWTAYAALTVVLLSATGSDPDLWGHVRFGLDWWRTHSLPSLDVYSFMQDKPWINHEWLSEVAMAAAYHAGGALGLIVLKILVIGTVLLVLGARLRGTTALMKAAYLTFAMLCVLRISLTVRPHLWSVLGLAVLVSLMHRPRPTRWSAAGIVLLFAVWANLHGGWITGLAALGTYAVVRSIRRPREPRWLAVAVASAAATQLNPYGIGLWRFMAETVRPARPDIVEWQPLTFALPWARWVPAVGPVLVLSMMSIRRASRPPIEVWAIIALLTASAVRVMRVGPLVAPAELILLAPFVRTRWGGFGRVTLRDSRMAAVMWIPVVVSLAAAIRPTANALGCIRIKGPGSPDREAAALLQGRSGRLWVAFDWGEYALWHFGPRLKVSIDGRRETIYSEAVIQLHRDVERGDPPALDFVTSVARPDFVWLRSDDLTAKVWLADHGYRIGLDTGQSFIAERTDERPLPVYAPPLSSCFP